jgi:hypothetical protein
MLAKASGSATVLRLHCLMIDFECPLIAASKAPSLLRQINTVTASKAR